MDRFSRIISRLFLLLILVCFSCKKDKPIIGIDNPIAGCSNKYISNSTALKSTYKGNEEPPCLFMPNYIQTTEFFYSKPLINPNNPFEFIVHRLENTSVDNFGNLYFYNFCDNSLTLITSNCRAYYYDWSSDNWIIFYGPNGTFWKVRPDGTEFIQLNSNAGSFPTWNPDGSKYIYKDLSLPLDANMRINYSDGSSFDIIPHYMRAWTWLNNDEVLFSTNNVIQKYNLENETTSHFASLPAGNISFMYVKDETIYITAKNGFYEVTDNTISLIDPSYLTFRSYSVNPISSNYYLLHRQIQDTSDYDNCNVYVTNIISLYNKTTKEERVINLPYLK